MGKQGNERELFSRLRTPTGGEVASLSLACSAERASRLPDRGVSPAVRHRADHLRNRGPEDRSQFSGESEVLPAESVTQSVSPGCWGCPVRALAEPEAGFPLPPGGEVSCSLVHGLRGLKRKALGKS